MQLLGTLLDEFQVLTDIERQERHAETEADLDLILCERRRRCRAEHSERRKPKHKSAQSFCSSLEGRDYSPQPGWSEAKSGLRQKILPEPLARGKRLAEIQTVDDGEPETAGRHGVVLRRAVLMKADLYAGDAGRAPDLID